MLKYLYLNPQVMFMSRVLDTKSYLDTVCDLLREGHTHVSVTVAGTSMTPFLDPGDTVFLDLLQGPAQVGDVILFARFGVKYVLHRVVQVFPDGSLELLGDAQVRSERVLPDQVRAVVTAVRRGEKLLDERSLRWRFFRGPWRHVRRLRPWVNRIRNHVRR